MKEEKDKINKQLLRTTVFNIQSKEELKKDICNLIDKRFEFLEKYLKGANEAFYKLSEEEQLEVERKEREELK